MSLPAPLTYPDLDVRHLQYMPLDVVRLRDSDIAALASGDAFRAAVLLWCHAWHQVPAASLPADDANLARYSGYGRDVKGWLKVKDEALRGFVLCSDGRLYHAVIAEKATEADNKSRAYRARASKGGKAKSARQAVLEAPDKQEPSTPDAVLGSAKVREGKGIEEHDGGDARASLIEPRSYDLAAELAKICGHPTPDHWPPGWCGAPMWVQKCLNEGWIPDVMIAETRAVVGRKRDGPPDNFIYLEKPLARAHAMHQAPLPKVEIPAQETINGSQPPVRAGGSALAAIREVQRGLRGDADRDAPRSLPKG